MFLLILARWYFIIFLFSWWGNFDKSDQSFIFQITMVSRFIHLIAVPSGWGWGHPGRRLSPWRATQAHCGHLQRCQFTQVLGLHKYLETHTTQWEYVDFTHSVRVGVKLTPQGAGRLDDSTVLFTKPPCQKPHLKQNDSTRWTLMRFNHSLTITLKWILNVGC